MIHISAATENDGGSGLQHEGCVILPSYDTTLESECYLNEMRMEPECHEKSLGCVFVGRGTLTTLLKYW